MIMIMLRMHTRDFNVHMRCCTVLTRHFVRFARGEHGRITIYNRHIYRITDIINEWDFGM